MRRVVIALILLLLAGLGVRIWLGEWVREEYEAGYTAAAQRDAVLGAKRFLARHGVASSNQEVQGLGLLLPGPNDALLFLASRLALSDSMSTRLDVWIRSGGHLITVPTTLPEQKLYGREDSLLNGLGMSVAAMRARAAAGAGGAAGVPANAVEAREAEALEDARDTDEPAYDDEGCTVQPVQWLQAPADPDTLAVGIDTPLRLAVTPAAALAVETLGQDSRGALLLSRRHGRGRVTVIVDGELWRNDQIDCLDHAHLLWRLVGPARTLASVTVAERPTLFDLLARQGLPLLASSGLLLLLWLWRAGQGFGPLLPSPLPVRRERAEALRATGEYLWRRRAIADLLAGVRARVRQTARRRTGDENGIGPLARRARIDAAVAAAAMTDAPRHERDLIATTRTLKELIEQ